MTTNKFGRELQRRREIAGLPKRRLADLSGITEGRIRQLETGIQRVNGEDVPARPTAATVSRLAQALGWDEADALTLAGLSDAPRTPGAGRPSRSDQEDALTQQMLSIWRQLAPEQRSALVQLLDIMKSP